MASPPRSAGRTGRAARATGRAAQGVALLVSFVLMAGIGGVLVAGLALPAVALADGATNVTTEAFDELPTDVNLTQLPQKSVILAADGTLLATFYDQNRDIVSLQNIAPIMQKAVIAIEDRRFYEHSGIDPQGMLRAFAATVLSKDTQGASTLTQQYIKNVFIQDAQTIEDPVKRQAAIEAATVDTGTEGYARKLREAKLAISLEKKMTKDQILEAYLNIVQFGAKSIYGVEAAAEYYFDKPAKDLDYLQAATIAGVTQNPTKWDPELNPAQSQVRRNLVLAAMHDQGYITTAQYTKGIATPLKSTLKITPVKQGCMMASTSVAGAGFFCDYVTKVILNDPAFGADQKTRQQLLYRGGLTITTTLIPSEQTTAVQAVEDHVPKDDPSGVGDSIVTVEPGTGKITSMAENRDYSALANAGSSQTSVNWNTTNAYGGSQGFMPGSSFKVFTLIEWLKQGHSLSETFNGTQRPLNVKDFTACGKPAGSSQVRTPGNSEGSGGYMNALTATKNSVNTAYLAMAEQLDLCNIMQDAADLGVVQPGGQNAGQNIEPYPSNVIGSANVSPLSMAAAYAAIANNGTYCKPIAITKVVDANGKDVPVPSADCQQKLEPQIASAVTYAMQQVWSGTAKQLGKPSYPAAGKTGTTSQNEDIWFVGYTPLRATAVWVGYPDSSSKSMHGQTIAGHSYVGYSQGPYGADIPGPIWRQFMDTTMAGQSVPAFTTPGNTEVYGKQTSVPNVVGLEQSVAKSTLTNAGFTVQVSRTQVTDASPAGTVVQQSPTGTAPAHSLVTLTVSNGQGAQPPPTQQPTTDSNGNGNGQPSTTDKVTGPTNPPQGGGGGGHHGG